MQNKCRLICVLSNHDQLFNRLNTLTGKKRTFTKETELVNIYIKLDFTQLTSKHVTL